MRRHFLDLVILFVSISVVCVFLILTVPDIRSTTLRAYLFAVGGLLMLGVVATGGEPGPRRQGSELNRVLSEQRPHARTLPELERIERAVTLAVESDYDLHVRLLPDLREIARCRLERTGRTPGPETLGRWWDLLREDRPEPDERFGAGIAQSELRALVADLERM